MARGLCASGPDGRLESITEQTGILAADVGAGRKFSGRETVSMNCWGFTPGIFKESGIRLVQHLSFVPSEGG